MANLRASSRNRQNSGGYQRALRLRRLRRVAARQTCIASGPTASFAREWYSFYTHLEFQFDGHPQTMRTFVVEPGAVTPPEVVAAQQAAAQTTTTAAPAQPVQPAAKPH